MKCENCINKPVVFSLNHILLILNWISDKFMLELSVPIFRNPELKPIDYHNYFFKPDTFIEWWSSTCNWDFLDYLLDYISSTSKQAPMPSTDQPVTRLLLAESQMLISQRTEER